jgi:photosystem II stability/assembly factor-like uncharacterized protein
MFDVPEPGDRYDAMSFVSPRVGWVAGTLIGMMATKDGGHTWADVTSILDSNNRSPFLRTIAFASERVGWAGSLGKPKLLQTTDGGESWRVPPGFDTAMVGVVCGTQAFDEQTFYCVGAWSARQYGQPHFSTTTNGGQTFVQQAMKERLATLVDLEFATPQIGVVGGSIDGGPSDGHACVLRTTNGGATWDTTYRCQYVGTQIWKFQRRGADTLWASIQSIGSGPPLVLTSVDDGRTWREIEVRYANGDPVEGVLQGVGFITAEVGWASGRGFFLYETRDGGASWRYVDPSILGLNKMQQVADTLIVAAGTTCGALNIPNFLTGTSVEKGASQNVPADLIAQHAGSGLLRVTVLHKAAVRYVHVYTSSGQLVHTVVQPPTELVEYSINLGSIARGLYIVVVFTDVDMVTAKVAVQ